MYGKEMVGFYFTQKTTRFIFLNMNRVIFKNREEKQLCRL